jgi:hypothetical protein
MRADRADQLQSTTYGKVLSGSRFDMFPLFLSVENEDRRLAGEHNGGADRNLMVWNAAIYCTLVVRDSLIVSLR